MFQKGDEKDQMRKLYGTIMISKQIIDKANKTLENINYYKLKNQKFGIEIVKKNEKADPIEIANISNITDSEEAINYILSLLIQKRIMPNESDVIDDLVKQYV